MAMIRGVVGLGAATYSWWDAAISALFPPYGLYAASAKELPTTKAQLEEAMGADPSTTDNSASGLSWSTWALIIAGGVVLIAMMPLASSRGR